MIVTNNGSFPLESPAGGGTAPADVDRRIRAAIEAQVAAGCRLVTDGLVRGRDPVVPLAGALRGLETDGRRGTFPDGTACLVPVIAAELSWARPFLVEDFLFASRGTEVPLKVVLPGPYSLARIADDRAYHDPMALAMALATALNQELRALQTAGAGFIQVNEPALLKHREDFPLFTRIWEVLGRGIGAVLCLHLQGGDVRGLHPGLGRLKRLGCLSLDCVAGPANLELLSEAPFPEGPRLSLGLVDGGSTRVESPEEIAAALSRAAGLPARERILLGNASDLGDLAPAIAAAKLQALVRAAALAA